MKWLSYLLLNSYLLAYTIEHFPTQWEAPVYVLRISPHEHEIFSVKAKDRAILPKLALAHHAIGGINGGYWHLDGSPAGLLRCGGTTIGSTSKYRGVMAWKDSGKTYAFTRATSIPLSWATMDHVVGGALLLLKNNERLNITEEKTIESFRHKKHARTVVGVWEEGTWGFISVQGSTPFRAGGMTIEELTCLCEELGFQHALNLDGGSSTALFLEGKSLILPKRGYKVPISDAILFR